jgi:hypothetical protein
LTTDCGGEYLHYYSMTIFAKYNYNDEVKEDEMVTTCNTNEGEDENT